MPKIFVTGGAGLVGSRFLELSGFKDNIVSPTIEELDLGNRPALDKFISDNCPDWIVNFPAYTNVTEGEKERGNKDGLCWKVNIDALNNLCEAVKPSKTKLIQISTDMVFPGSEEKPGPYLETDLPEADPAKITWYGYTKSEGEKMVRSALGNRGIILRLIYPVRAKYGLKQDYLRKPLSLYDHGKLYPLFNDQQICISFIDEISAVLDRIIDNNGSGIFHCASRDTTTPFEIVSYLLEKARGVRNVVQTSSLKTILAVGGNNVRYPLLGGLKIEETESRLGIKFSTAKEIVDKLIEQGIEA